MKTSQVLCINYTLLNSININTYKHTQNKNKAENYKFKNVASRMKGRTAMIFFYIQKQSKQSGAFTGF